MILIGQYDSPFVRRVAIALNHYGMPFERLEGQNETSILWLEALPDSEWLVGDALTRADLAVAVAATYAVEKLPRLFDPARMPQLDGHRRRCESSPVFAAAAYSAAEALATGWRPEAR